MFLYTGEINIIIQELMDCKERIFFQIQFLRLCEVDIILKPSMHTHQLKIDNPCWGDESYILEG